MLTASLFTLASAMGAMAMPTAYPIYRRAMSGNSGIDDTTVLQYALTLEHLENKF
jgi:multidrug transporter EmrE-like cation transporter